MTNEDDNIEVIYDSEMTGDTDEILRISEELKAVTQEFNNALRGEVEKQDRKKEDPEALLDELE